MSDLAPEPTKSSAFQAPNKRRWSLRSLIQFRLRTLLILTAVVAAALGWHLRKTKLQREAVAKITDYGGWVYYDFEYATGTVLGPKAHVAGSNSPFPDWLVDRLGIDFFHNVVVVNLVYNDDLPAGRQDNRNDSPEILAELERLPRIRLLLLKDLQADDEYMRHVGQLRDLQGLYVWYATKLTDTGVAHLAGCRNLEEIHIDNSQISDTSLSVFGRMPRMRRLVLPNHRFSDHGVQELQQLRNLEELSLDNAVHQPSQLTDASLRVFEQFPNLTLVSIQNTAVSREAIADFERRHPNCRVWNSVAPPR